jgi:hypothetical protein
VVPCLDIAETLFFKKSTDFTGLLLLASLMTIFFVEYRRQVLCKSNMLMESWRGWVINVYVDLMSLSDFYMGLCFWSVLSTDM